MYESADMTEGWSGASDITQLIRANDTAGVEAYLQNHPDIYRWYITRDDGEDDGEPVMLAARVGSLEVLQFLMTANGDTDWAGPLRAACVNGQVEVARWILDNSKDAVTEFLQTSDDGCFRSLLLQSLSYHPPWGWREKEHPIPIHIRAHRQEEIIHLLLDRGASVHDKHSTNPQAREKDLAEFEDLYPVEEADAQWGSSYVADWSWEVPPRGTSYMDTTFMAAECFQGLDGPWMYSSPTVPAKPLELKKPVLLHTVLTEALSFRSAHLISRLINDGCGIHTRVCVYQDINIYEEQTEDVTPLHLACHYKNIAGVRLLLQAGASNAKSMVGARDSCGMTPLHCTALDSLDLYDIYPGFNWEESHMTPSEKIKACMELLLDCDPTILDARDRWGRTALHYASMLDSGDVAEFLLERGADPNIKGDDARTPLVGRFITAPVEKSRTWQHPVVVLPATVTPATLNLESFLRHGARLDEMNANGDTLLHIACRSWTRGGVVQWLLEHNVRADIPNKKKQLPLHIAAKCLNAWDDGFDGLNEALRAQDDIIRMLKEAGAGDIDMTQPDADGITPAQTLEAGRKKASRIFEAQGLARAKRECGEVENRQFKLGYKRLPDALRELTIEKDAEWRGRGDSGQVQRHVSIGNGDADVLRGTGKVLGLPPRLPRRLARPRGRSLEQGGSLYI
ncbi:hypothetical protein PG988_011620 [Apiospora saccharicola]